MDDAASQTALTTGTLHHVELWVPDIGRAVAEWGWLLDALGYEQFQDWPGGRSWRQGATHIVAEQSADLTADRYDRCRPGLNHLAFHVIGRCVVDRLTIEAADHGWSLMYPSVHPYAGGPDNYAAYLSNGDGYEVELVATDE